MYYSIHVRAKRTSMVLLMLSVWTFGIAANLSSVATPFGNWNTNSTWNGGSTPSSSNCVDTIFINEHVYFTNQQNLTSCSPIVLFIRDTLRFKNGPKLYLPVGSQVIIDSNGLIMPEGSGSSSAIDVGGVEFWKADDGVVNGPLNLPVDLMYFRAQIVEHNIVFEWATAMEVNCNFFSVEELDPELGWGEVGLVRGAGNSEIRKNYRFSIPYEKEASFRLTQTDYDGKYHILTSIWVSDKSPQTSIQLSPNPGRDFISIKAPWDMNGQTTISVLNNNGQVVWSKLCDDGQNAEQEILNVSGLEPGVYTVQISRPDRPIRSATIMVQ